MRLPRNKVLCGDAIEVMRARIPDDSIDLVITSPPYWGLRDYGVETVRVWDGSSECEHEWGETLPSTLSDHKNIGFADRAKENYRGGGHKTVEIAEKHLPSEAGQFCIKCGAWRGSIGLEPHPQMFIDHLVEICREIKRVLKPSGTFFINLGDTYYGGPSRTTGRNDTFNPGEDFHGQTKYYERTKIKTQESSNWLQPKQKLMIPSRIAIALQHDGWILRNDIIWHKPNAMPGPWKDRLTNAYEHVFLFVKNNEIIYWVDRFTGQLTSSQPVQYYIHDETGVKRFDRPKRGVDKDWFNEDGTRKFKYAWQGHDYYFDLASIRKPHAESSLNRIALGKVENRPSQSKESIKGKGYKLGYKYLKLESKGKNPGDMWRIPTIPFPGAHFATFPPKLIEPIVKAGSPRWVCSRCGKPRERITEKTGRYSQNWGIQHKYRDKIGEKIFSNSYETTGWSDCGCGEKWVGGVVLDPFGGSGTVGKVARRLGRRFILIEIIPEYTEMSEQRVRGKYKPIPKGVIPLTQFMEDK